MNFLKKVVVLCTLTLLPVWLVAQDVISNVVSEGNEQKHVFQEYQGRSYIIKINSSDNLFVYRFEGEELVLLHTNYLEGMYEDNEDFHFSRWMLYDKDDGLVAYDFVNDEFKSVDEEEGMDRSFWRVLSNDVVIAHQASQDYTLRKNYILDRDLNTYFISEGLDYPSRVSNNHYLYRTLNENNEYDFSTVDRETGVEVASISLDRDISIVFDEDILLYFNEETQELIEHDFASHESEVIYTSSSELEGYSLLSTEHQFSLTWYDSELEMNIALVINKHDHKMKLLEEADIEYDYTSLRDVVLYRKSSGVVGVYNFNTDEITLLMSSSSPSYIFSIGNRYLLYHTFSKSYIYDVQTDERVEYFFPFSYDVYSGREELEIGGKYYIDLNITNESYEDMIVFDETNMTLDFSDIVPLSKRGLLESTVISSSGNDVLVLNSDQLYAINNNTIEQLNTSEIVNNFHISHMKDSDGLLWGERSDEELSFYKYNEKDKNLLAIFSKDTDYTLYEINVNSFIDGENTIMINGRYGYHNALVLIDKSDNSLIEVIDGEIDFFGLGIYHDGYYYTTHTFSDVTRISEAGEVEQLNFAQPALSLNSAVVFQDKLYLINGNKVVSISDGVVTDEFELSGEIGLTDGFSVELDHIIFKSFFTTYIKRGEVWEELSFDYPTSFFQEPLFDTYLRSIEKLEDDTEITRLYNLSTDEYFELPEEIATKHVAESFTKDGEQYLIITDNESTNFTVTIYKMSDMFSEATKITFFESSGLYSRVKFGLVENGGLMQAGDMLFEMDEELDFTAISMIDKDNSSVFIDKETSSFYFIAIHPERGRQVFSLSQMFGPNSTENTEISDVEIYPNPAQDILRWHSDVYQDKEVSIDVYNLQGKWMMTTDKKSIDISNLHTGMHVATFRSAKGEDLGSFKFMKVEE